jgi:hypothetical protein
VTESNRILVHRVGDAAPWSAPESSTYADEAHLQEVLAASPHWIPGVPEGSLSVRELHTSAGPVDVVILAADGALTVVECKLESNPDKRRMVIGQVIDYAAAISGDGFDSFRTAWTARGGPDLGTSLAPESLEELRLRIETATIGLCLAVDRIDRELQRLVEYLNRITHDRISVTAVQLSYARHRDLEVLIPSTFGGEIAAAKGAQGAGQADRWTRQTFIAAVEHPDDQNFLSQILDRLDEDHCPPDGRRDPIWYGTRPGGGVFFHLHGLRRPPFALRINGAGRLTIKGTWQGFKETAGHPGFADLAAMLGQDESGPARYVQVDGIDPDALLDVAETAAREINQ